MTPRRRQRLTTALLGVLSAGVALVVAAIVTLNLHIFLGVEDGYMAGPGQVVERSVWLLVTDVVILVAAPVLAVRFVVRQRRDQPEP